MGLSETGWIARLPRPLAARVSHSRPISGGGSRACSALLDSGPRMGRFGDSALEPLAGGAVGTDARTCWRREEAAEIEYAGGAAAVCQLRVGRVDRLKEPSLELGDRQIGLAAKQ